jgi:hypothetical protein
MKRSTQHAPSQQALALERDEQLEYEELARIARNHVDRWGRGAQAQLAEAAGVPRAWLNRLLAPTSPGPKTSISRPRLRAVLGALNYDVAVFEAAVGGEPAPVAQPSADSGLTPLQAELIKATAGMRPADIQPLVWFARELRRRQFRRPGTAKCPRCGGLYYPVQRLLPGSGNLCLSCGVPVLDRATMRDEMRLEHFAEDPDLQGEVLAERAHRAGGPTETNQKRGGTQHGK